MRHFIDIDGKLDKNALRLFVLDELLGIHRTLTPLLSTDAGGFLDRLHNAIAVENDDVRVALKQIESKLYSLPEFINSYIQSSVDTPERLEFFIEVKANELAESDQKHGYYWAQLIRHDQLLATVLVLNQALGLIADWVNKPLDEVLADEAFLGFANPTLEDKIYLAAKALYEQRTNQK